MLEQKKRCVIIGGADITDYERMNHYLLDSDYYIYCDSGLNHLEHLKGNPNLIVGDFDSHVNPNLLVETIVLPCEKDDTDTVFAVKEGIRRGFDEFLLLGVVGKRLDHTLGNVSILLYLDSIGKKGIILDPYGEMEIVSRDPVLVPDSFAFFSLLNISGVARGITIQNAKYPLTSAEIPCEYQYGISNEVLPGKQARITVEEGKLLLVKIMNSSIV